MTKSLEQRRDQLIQQAKKLDAKIRKEKRKTDTRRKVLLGAYILNKLETTDRNTVLNDLKTNLPRFLEREQDIKLFQDILQNDILNDKN